MNRISTSIFFVALTGAASLYAQNPLSTEAKNDYTMVKNNILKAADKVPDADYAFKPTPEIRNFGELLAHIADAQMGMCGAAKGEMKRGDAASKTSKADLVAALKASFEYCDGAYNALTDADATQMVKMFGQDRSKLGVLNFNTAHDNEIYGTMAVYMRLKGIVPPSTSDRPMGNMKGGKKKM